MILNTGPSEVMYAEAIVSSRRILLIADCLHEEMAISSMLESYGLTAELIYIGSRDLSMVYEHQPVAIIIDEDTINTAAHHLCHQLRADRRIAETPIIVLSRSYETHLALAVLQAGADDYIAKDMFVGHNLVEALRYLTLL